MTCIKSLTKYHTRSTNKFKKYPWLFALYTVLVIILLVFTYIIYICATGTRCLNELPTVLTFFVAIITLYFLVEIFIYILRNILECIYGPYIPPINILPHISDRRSQPRPPRGRPPPHAYRSYSQSF